MSYTNKGAGVDVRLQNVANALYLTTSNLVAIRTGIEGDVYITGPVTIPGTVTVTSTPEDPVHVHVTELTSGTITVTNFTSTVQVSNNVSATITGSVSILGTPTVNIGSIPEVEIKNDVGNPIPVSKNTTVNSDTNPIFVKGTSDTSFFAPTQSDAFGRLRVSEPYTLHDSFNRYQDNGGSFNYTTGTASIGYDSNNAAITMTVGTTNGDTAYRETARVFAYQPGKSLLTMMTFTMSPAKTGLTQRIGYFDTANGIYLEQAGSTVNIVKRSSSSGSLVETRIIQANWNVDTLPGLDLTKSQIFWTDIEWLGVGTVRCGFVIDGQFIHCHSFNHANYTTGTYITTSCLPVRREIFNTADTSATSTMLGICQTVISEGGYHLTGRSKCIGHDLGSPVNLPNDASLNPVISIRLKNSRPGAIVLPTTFNVTPVQQAMYKYQIHTRAITTGGTWVSAGADSSVEYNLSPTSIVTTGTISASAFINATNQTAGASQSASLPFQYQLERNSFVPTMYELVIMVASSGNSTTAYGAINWEEIT